MYKRGKTHKFNTLTLHTALLQSKFKEFKQNRHTKSTAQGFPLLVVYNLLKKSVQTGVLIIKFVRFQ